MIDRQVNYTPQIVKKSNFLIEKHNYLTAVNQKILNFVISYVQKYKITTNNLEIPVRKVTNLIGKKEVYKTKEFFSKIGENLVSNILNLIEPTENECDITNLISRFKLKDGIINIKLTDEFLSLIHVEKDYTKIDLNITKPFKSKHSSVLYEYYLMKLKYNTHYSKNKMFTTHKTEIEILRKLLCKNSKSYRNIDLFKRKILKPALEEINNKTDLKISFEDVKCEFNNKTITGFNFTINQNEVKQIIVNDIQEIKKEDEIALKPNHDNILNNYPQEISSIASIGIKPAQKLLNWYKEDKNRLLANWHEISTKYADKSNAEKAKLMAYLWKIKANYISPEEIQAKEKELAEKAQHKAKIEESKHQETVQKKALEIKVKNKLLATEKKYNKLPTKEKLQICTIVARGLGLKLNKCTEDDAYLDFNNLSNLYKHGISEHFNYCKVDI